MSDPEATAQAWDHFRQRFEALTRATRPHSTDPAVLAEKLARRAERLRGQLQPAVPAGPQLVCLSFSFGAQRYALPMDNVLEVHPLEQFTPVPGAPAFIRGVVQCRGTILALLDLGRLFGIDEAGLADIHYYIVAESAGRRVALAAGVAEDIVSVPLDKLRPPPGLAADVPGDWVRAIYDENRTVLELGRILQHERLIAWHR